MAALRAVLPAPPTRIAEIGCGRGALSAALADQGYDVTGIDRDAHMTAATQARGVPTIHADVLDVTDHTFDVLLFTRSLHHAEDLGEPCITHGRSCVPAVL